jgi:hypothetical protein
MLFEVTAINIGIDVNVRALQYRKWVHLFLALPVCCACPYPQPDVAKGLLEPCMRVLPCHMPIMSLAVQAIIMCTSASPECFRCVLTLRTLTGGIRLTERSVPTQQQRHKGAEGRNRTVGVTNNIYIYIYIHTCKM